MPLLFLALFGVAAYFVAKHAGITVNIPDPGHNLPAGPVVVNFVTGPKQQTVHLAKGQQLAVVVPDNKHYDGADNSGAWDQSFTKISDATNKDGSVTVIFGATAPGTGRMPIAQQMTPGGPVTIAFTLDWTVS